MPKRRATATAPNRLPADQLPADHPLRVAQWIWPCGFLYLHNHFAQLRKDFTLARIPRRAPLAITADKNYRLWINGRYVCRGPARGYQDHWPYDEVDVAAFLRSGHNWIAIEAYNPGISTFQYRHATAAKVICAARWGAFTLVTDSSWQMRRSPAHATQTARLSLQIDFQEHVSPGADDRSWVTAPTSPTGWVPDRRLFEVGMDPAPFGRPPYNTVEPRGIPMLRETEVAPTAVVAHVVGANGPDWRTWENVSWGWIDEVRGLRWDDGASVRRQARDGWLEVVIPASGDGRWRAVAVDCGEYLVGSVAIAIDGAVGGEVLDLHYHEHLVDGRPDLRRPQEACGVAMASRLRLPAGSCQHEFFHLLGFRHCTLVARDSSRDLTVRLRIRTAGYPFTMRGRFACSDPGLEAIHAICARTQRICSLDAYVDTPWREQAQWWGDARVQAANTMHLDGDARLLARGIRSIAEQPAANGLTWGHAPTIAYNCVLPDFALTWILTIRDHWWQTGDASLVREQWPRIAQVLAYFDTPEARHATGLLRHDRRFWLFEDWSELWKGEVPTFLNLWYVLALRELATVLAAAGMRSEARHWARRAEVHARLVVAKLFDRRRRLMREGLDAPASRASVHDQCLAMMLGLAPAAHPTMLAERLLPWIRGQPVDGAVPSAFWSHYVLERLGMLGHGTEVVAFIRTHWTPMLATGTTWEGFTWSEDSGGTASHAWTAHPSVHLVAVLAGIRQEAPAWRAVRIAPQAVAGIDAAEALVPSPSGDIVAQWRRRGSSLRLDVRVPRGVRAVVELGGTRRVLRTGGRLRLEHDVEG